MVGMFVLNFVLFVGYLLAYIFHIASCGLLFRFVEFTPCSCFVGNCVESTPYSWLFGKCGLTVDRGGPDGLGFSHGRVGFNMIFPMGGGGGGGGGDGDGDGGGDGGGGDGGGGDGGG